VLERVVSESDGEVGFEGLGVDVKVGSVGGCIHEKEEKFGAVLSLFLLTVLTFNFF
jgi:hypothetical protein